MRLIELCAGGAALSLHLLGARNQLVPYQGSKWRLRKELAGLLPSRERPTHIVLNDPGPWGPVWEALIWQRGSVLQHLEVMASRDPRRVYEYLQGARTPPRGSARYAAEFLFLQRLAFSGKAVQDSDSRWSAPGFNETSAYGKPGTDKFGKVNPMVPSLIATLRQTPAEDLKAALSVRAQDLEPGPGWVVYIDPPYKGTTGYGDRFDRAEVFRAAEAWARAGSYVLVSEAEPLSERAVQIRGPKEHGSPFKTGKPEWVTFFGDEEAACHPREL